MNHIIQKQMVDVSAPTLKSMQLWEQRVQGVLAAAINPTVEECLDEVSDEVKSLVIDKLQIDLGVLSNLTTQQITHRVKKELTQQLQKYKTPVRVNQSNHNPPQKSTKESPYRTLEKQEIQVTSFVYFLTHGRLPWWVDSDMVEMQGKWIKQLSRQELATVAREIKSHSQASDRLIYQFDAEFITVLLSYYNKPKSRSVLLCWNWLKMISPTSKVKLAFWNYGIRKCLNITVDTVSLVHALKEWILHRPKVAVQIEDLIETQKQTKNDPESFKGERQAAAKLLSDIWPFVQETADPLLAKSRASDEDQKVKPQVEELTVQSDPPADPEILSLDRSFVSDKKQTNNNTEPEKQVQSNDVDALGKSFLDEDEEYFYCGAAGLVILHPFLVELFQLGGLWNKNGWTSATAQNQAIVLVNWLAFGDVDRPEYELLIPKLLCGMAWEEPLDLTITLNKGLIQSGTELLETVVNHWKVLGNTSIDGLREGFIRRQGRLTNRNDGWQLTVEKKAQDILLNKLPWGVSFIRFPWLKENHIHVDWI